MKVGDIEEIRNNEIVRKRFAKVLASYCFRDTKLESFHDRLSNEEMKEIMIDVVNRCDYFLQLLFTTPKGDEMIGALKGAGDKSK